MREFAKDTAEIRGAVTRALALAQQQAMRHLFHRQVVENLPGRRILAVGAHPDDIAIGCGGSLWKARKQAEHVGLVCMTDGRLGVADGGDEDAAVEVRAAEERQVAARMGLAEPEMIGCSERTFLEPQQRGGLVQQLADVLLRQKPDTVLVPDLSDQHPDHRYVSSLLAEALAQYTPERVITYEVWSFTPPGLVVDISSCFEAKKELVACYASQLELVDYLQFADTLGRMRAPLAGPDAVAAEVFCPYRPATFLEAVQGQDASCPAGSSVQVLLTPPDLA